MNKQKKLLSDLKLYSDYLKWNTTLDRYETWEEACGDIINQHKSQYKHVDISEELEYVRTYMESKKVLASQRNLQFRGDDIFKHNARLYNCSSTYIDRPEVFGQIMYLLLCGCGVGFSVEQRYVEALPTVKHRLIDTDTYIVEDSIEGWAMALDKLIQSYFTGGKQIRFDYTQIRPKGSLIANKFLAPGHEPLKRSLEIIEASLEHKTKGSNLTPIECYDIICHASDAVLSAGLRRSALICLFDKDDVEMINAKTGDWFVSNPQRGRSNNSVKLIKGQYTKEEYDFFTDKVKQFGEPGFALVDDERFCTNPCFEIGFIPINPFNGNSCISFCNLNEINAKGINTKAEFMDRIKAATILGTLQSGYVSFPFLGKDTEELVAWESLLGISITGWFDNPKLFNEEWLRDGAEYAKTVNMEFATKLGINPSARLTCTKPSGNASVILGTSSGIHPAHSKRYFRVMQMNKESEVAKWLVKNKPEMLEESVWSANKTDYCIYVPIEEDPSAITKDEITSIEFLDKIKFAQEHWVMNGSNKELGYSAQVTHNISNTVIVDDWDETFDYIYNNRDYFCGVSFLPRTGDKIYRQAPFTKVLTLDEIVSKYGDGSLFVSGLIVDLLHTFNGDLWDACDAITNRSYFLTGGNVEVLVKKDMIRRSKKFAKNFFKGDLDLLVECLKDTHLYHKWCKITRGFKSEVDLQAILTKPKYLQADELGAVACSGGVCEIV